MTTELKRYTTENPLKILSLGWGVQSWALAAMAALGEIPKPDFAVHADTTHEMEGTYAHAAKWTPWLEDTASRWRRCNQTTLTYWAAKLLGKIVHIALCHQPLRRIY